MWPYVRQYNVSKTTMLSSLLKCHSFPLIDNADILKFSKIIKKISAVLY